MVFDHSSSSSRDYDGCPPIALRNPVVGEVVAEARNVLAQVTTIRIVQMKRVRRKRGRRAG